MKIKIAGIVCVVVLVGAWVYVHAQTNVQPVLPAGANGRYQVLPVEFDSRFAGEPNQKMVVRIDTQTGKTWVLIEYGDATPDGKEGEHHLGWTELREIK